MRVGGEEEDAFMMAASMLSRRGRRWVDRDGKEEEVEEDDNGVTIAALGGVGRRNGDRLNAHFKAIALYNAINLSHHTR